MQKLLRDSNALLQRADKIAILNNTTDALWPIRKLALELQAILLIYKYGDIVRKKVNASLTSDMKIYANINNYPGLGIPGTHTISAL